MCDNPVIIGGLIGLALLIGVYVGHVLTFRTAYYFRIYRKEGDEEP